MELKNAKKFGKNLCDLSLKVRDGNVDLLPKFELIENTWWEKESKFVVKEGMRNVSPKFSISLDKCTKCLLCQDECPTDSIDIEADPPEIQKDGCIFCWYCEKLCPVGAIEADWTMMGMAMKRNLKKYIIELKKAELKGEFRPYVDYENIK